MQLPACCTACSGVADRAAPIPPHAAPLSVHLRLETPARQGIGTEEGNNATHESQNFVQQEKNATNLQFD